MLDIQDKIDKLIVAKLNRESLLDELEPFGHTEVNRYAALGSNPILQIDLVTITTLPSLSL